MNLQIITIISENDQYGDDYIEPLDIISDNCPKCKKPNSLIITHRKDRYKLNTGVQAALLKVECICCKWKVMRDFKWKMNVE